MIIILSFCNLRKLMLFRSLVCKIQDHTFSFTFFTGSHFPPQSFTALLADHIKTRWCVKSSQNWNCHGAELKLLWCQRGAWPHSWRLLRASMGAGFLHWLLQSYSCFPNSAQSLLGQGAEQWTKKNGDYETVQLLQPLRTQLAIYYSHDKKEKKKKQSLPKLLHLFDSWFPLRVCMDHASNLDKPPIRCPDVLVLPVSN